MTVVGSDETGYRVNGKKHWFHVWQNNILTFIVSFASGGHKVIEEYFPCGFLHSFYVSDCWVSQLKTRAKAYQHSSFIAGTVELRKEFTGYMECKDEGITILCDIFEAHHARRRLPKSTGRSGQAIMYPNFRTAIKDKKV
jgi:hypothetical protein